MYNPTQIPKDTLWFTVLDHKDAFCIPAHPDSLFLFQPHLTTLEILVLYQGSNSYPLYLKCILGHQESLNSIFKNFYLFLAALGLRYSTRALAACRLSLVAAGEGILSSCGDRLLSVVASLVVELGLQSTWAQYLWLSVVVAHGLCCPMVCGILVFDLGSNLCPLHWQADSQPRDYQESTPFLLLNGLTQTLMEPNNIHIMSFLMDSRIVHTCLARPWN